MKVSTANNVDGYWQDWHSVSNFASVSSVLQTHADAASGRCDGTSGCKTGDGEQALIENILRDSLQACETGSQAGMEFWYLLQNSIFVNVIIDWTINQSTLVLGT